MTVLRVKQSCVTLMVHQDILKGYFAIQSSHKQSSTLITEYVCRFCMALNKWLFEKPVTQCIRSENIWILLYFIYIPCTNSILNANQRIQAGSPPICHMDNRRSDMSIGCFCNVLQTVDHHVEVHYQGLLPFHVWYY